MEKKGAIEFSMTTIMVIIIGVAVLALGLAWIRGTFEQVETITESSLEAAETIVGEVAFSGKSSAPATITMKANDAKKFKILVRGAEGGGTYTATIKEIIQKKLDDGAANCFSGVAPSVGVAVESKGIGELVGGVLSSGPDCGTETTNGVMTIEIKEGKEGAVVYSTESITLQIR